MVASGNCSPGQLTLVNNPEEATSITVHIERWRADRKRTSPPSSAPSASVLTPPPSYPSSIPQQVGHRNVFKDQFFSLFLAHIYPGACDSNSLVVESNWVIDTLRLPSLSPALENASLAVCAARLGKRDDKPALVHKSLSLYTQSLREFQKEVAVAASRRSDQTLAACMMMLMYEVSECPGRTPDAYQCHYNAVMKLLELRGPEGHRSGLPHSVLQSLRVHAVSAFCST